ncbi:MAG: leucine-rich repeat domain-containing protein, partial [Lachnospiraceae bacterium]|nr:leucine-rich repeat domain-containing protein [Lachnospiraceae bacterium]
MKKMMAKMQTAAMLLSAVPAVSLPSIQAEASKAIRFNYTTAFCEDFEPNDSNRVALRQTILISPSNGMKQTGENVWDSGVILYGSSDQLYDPYSTPSVTTPPSSNHYVGAETLNPASYTFSSAQESGKTIDGDYYDPNGFVKKLTTNGSGHLIITLKDEFSDSQKRLIREGSNNYFDVYVWPDDDAYDNGTYYVRFQVGDYYKEDSTRLKDCYTADGFIENGEITIDSEGKATLYSISDTDRKTRMNKMDINLDDIYVSGVPYELAYIEEKCFKSAKMKSITANNLITIGASAFRDCSRLKKVNIKESETTKIYSRAFYECSKLSSIKMNGRELKKLGTKAFYGLKKNCKISIRGSKTKYKKVLTLIRQSKTSGVKCSRIDSD